MNPSSTRSLVAALCVGVALPCVPAWAAPQPISIGSPTGSVQESLVELVPARARAAFIVRKNILGQIRAAMMKDPAMMAELTPYLERTVGLDLTRIEGLAAFTTDVEHMDGHIGIILRIPDSSGSGLKLTIAGDAGGTPMYRLDKTTVVARIKAGLVLGTEAEVRAVVAVERGREPALPRDNGLGRLLGNDAGNIDVVLAVGPGAVSADKTMGVKDAILAYRHSGSVELALHGDPARLQILLSIAQAAIQAGLAKMQQDKDTNVATNDPVKGASAIMVYYQGKRFAAEIDPKLEGDALVSRYKMPDMAQGGASMMLAVVGVAAGVAVPAFTKYMRRSKTVEATMNVRRLGESIRALAVSDPKKLAALRTSEWTPKAACCGQTDNQCAPDASSWQTPTWKALGFSIDSPMRYQLRVRGEGKGKGARYVAEARGDLDCNSTFSTFQREITFDASGTAVIGELQSQNDTE